MLKINYLMEAFQGDWYRFHARNFRIVQSDKKYCGLNIFTLEILGFNRLL